MPPINLKSIGSQHNSKSSQTKIKRKTPNFKNNKNKTSPIGFVEQIQPFSSRQHETKFNLSQKSPKSIINSQLSPTTPNEKNIPKTYSEWKKHEQLSQQDKYASIAQSLVQNRERKERLQNIQSKIRSDALAKGNQNVENLEEALRMKLSRLRQINVSEEPFTYSLQKVHDRTFIHKILPCIQRQQLKHSPIGASNSKSPNLLRNTFSVEMYGEFLKHKNQMKNKQARIDADQQGIPQIIIDDTFNNTSSNIRVQDLSTPAHMSKPGSRAMTMKLPKTKGGAIIDHIKNIATRNKSSAISINKSQDGTGRSIRSAIGLSFKEKMEKLIQIRREQEKKQKFLEQLRLKRAQGKMKFDVDFFSSLEQKDMDSRLIEIIMYEINKMFTKEMLKYRGVTSEFNSMLKRKNLLEAKLFKKRYEKVQKHLNGVPNLDNTLNPFKRSYQPSIFNDKISDNKMDIPHNKELYENVIRSAFGDIAEQEEEGDDAQNLKDLTDEQIIDRIRRKFRKRVLEEGPEIIEKSLGQNTRFFQEMIEISKFKKLSSKIQGGVNKFQRAFRLKNKSGYSETISPRQTSMQEGSGSDTDQDYNQSSIFITQPFLPLPSQSHRVTPQRTQRSGMQNLPSHVANDWTTQPNSPTITSYLNYLTKSQINETTMNNKQKPQISTFSLKTKGRSRYSNSRQFISTTLNTQNPFINKKLSKQYLTKTSSKSSDFDTIISEVQKEIQIKDNIKQKARSKTLSTKDWDQIGQSKVLQFTILDRIIEDCGDYEKISSQNMTKSRLGLNIKTKNDISNEMIHTQSGIVNSYKYKTAGNTSKENLIQDMKKKNIEDTYTFLDKLQRINKLGEFEKLQFQ